MDAKLNCCYGRMIDLGSYQWLALLVLHKNSGTMIWYCLRRAPFCEEECQKWAKVWSPNRFGLREIFTQENIVLPSPPKPFVQSYNTYLWYIRDSIMLYVLWQHT